jgi:hypothetical protein
MEQILGLEDMEKTIPLLLIQSIPHLTQELLELMLDMIVELSLVDMEDMEKLPQLRLIQHTLKPKDIIQAIKDIDMIIS